MHPLRMILKHIPNALSLLRLGLIAPFLLFLYQHHYANAFYMFVLAGFTDGLDGWLARHFCWQSPLGSFIDPLADKLLIASSFISLALIGELPWWLVILVFLRDLTISLGVIAWYSFVQRKLDFLPTLLSKINTTLQLSLVTLCLLELAFFTFSAYVINTLILITALTTAATYIDYVCTWEKGLHDCSPCEMNQQLALTIQLNDEATLANFCWGSNTLLEQQLLTSLTAEGERLFYLWGSSGCGKSHLLQACCQLKQATAIYLPLYVLQEWGPESIDNLDQQTLIAIDDIDAIAGNRAWEEALFHLYNRVRDNGKTTLLIAGQQAPFKLAIALADLRSRLAWGLVVQLNELNDELKIKTIQQHALKRGFELPTPVGQFLLNRCARNMHDLHRILDDLDEASLAAQRRITIPFVKAILNL